ncbi:MAG TPA: YfhO family protein, partial [Chloroflexota bacterium]|nr:YfhO family protein [Chloroflexota bacterium]
MLAALTVGFFWRLLFLGQSLGGLDALEYFYPYRAYASAAIHEGRLPLWNPLIFGGVPFLANIQTALFYPFTGLFYILSATTAYTWSILIHVFLGAYFAYLFARFSLHLHAISGILVAFVFAFGGFMGAQLGHLNQFSAAIWLPALLLCWDQATSGRRPLSLLLGALTTALMILAGHPQEAYLALCTLLLYALFHTLWRLREQGPSVLAINAGATALILAVGALLSAVQLLPTAELTSWSIRSGGLPYALATTFSLKGTMLFNALLPPFWNRQLLLTVPGGSEFMGYVSLIGLLLALAGLLYQRSRHTVFFCLLALFSLSLALGKQNPLFPAFYRFVPGFSSLRVPARWLFPYTLSLAALAGLGAEALLHERRRLNWRPFVLLLALLAIGGALLARLE